MACAVDQIESLIARKILENLGYTESAALSLTILEVLFS